MNGYLNFALDYPGLGLPPLAYQYFVNILMISPLLKDSILNNSCSVGYCTL